MSVVDKITDLSISHAKEELRQRLEQTESQLSGNESDEQARMAKLQILTDLDLYEKVLKFAQTSTYSHELQFVAYALYKLKKLAELRELVEKHGEGAPILKLSLAQAEYSAGNFDSARSLLQSVKSQLNAGESSDIEMNLRTIDSIQGIWVDEPNPNYANFDLYFNYSCYLLSRGLYKEALATLEQASKYEQGEEDQQMLTVQTAYIYAKLGKHDDSKKLLTSLNAKQIDESLKPVVANNLLALNFTGTDLVSYNEALKAYDQSSSNLNWIQSRILKHNQLKLQGKLHRKHVVREARKFALSSKTDYEPLMVALNESWTPKQIKKASHGDGPISLAAKLLVNLPEFTYTKTELVPGNVGQLLDVLEHPEDDKSTYEKYFDGFQIPELKQAGSDLLYPENADLDRIQKEVESVVAGVDAEALDKESFVFTRTAPAAAPKPAKKSHKRKLPDNVDPNHKPDPERWLPKQDRSSYKPKRKKTQSTQGGPTTQGGSADTTTETSTTASSSKVVGGKNKSAKSKKKKGKK